jgi:hypothetical protein
VAGTENIEKVHDGGTGRDGVPANTQRLILHVFT